MSHEQKLVAQILVLAAFAALAMGVVLRRNDKPREIQVSETTIKILSESVGLGTYAAVGDLVTIAYVIRLPDGKVVLEDRDYSFEVGGNAVIDGVDEAVRGMRVGGERTVLCPPHKHWGRAGYGGKIPPVTDLTIEIRLKKVR